MQIVTVSFEDVQLTSANAGNSIPVTIESGRRLVNDARGPVDGVICSGNLNNPPRTNL